MFNGEFGLYRVETRASLFDMFKAELLENGIANIQQRGHRLHIDTLIQFSALCVKLKSTFLGPELVCIREDDAPRIQEWCIKSLIKLKPDTNNGIEYYASVLRNEIRDRLSIYPVDEIFAWNHLATSETDIKSMERVLDALDVSDDLLDLTIPELVFIFNKHISGHRYFKNSNVYKAFGVDKAEIEETNKTFKMSPLPRNFYYV